MSFINQRSEIGKLNTVLLHRPDAELEQISPDYLTEMLTDDTPHLPTAQKEHDAFAAVLRENGVNVLYLKTMFCEAVTDAEVRHLFIADYIRKSNITGDRLKELVRERFWSLSPEELFCRAARGVKRSDFADAADKPLQLEISDPYPFLIDPVPNAYFTRDIGVCIANGLVISFMSKPSRKLETLFLRYIYRYHPLFKSEKIPLWYDSNESGSLEGGDVLVLSDKVLAIGCGERTVASAVECLAGRLFQNGYEKILLFNNPRQRKFMHLDVLCTMVDYDKFMVDDCIAQKYFEVYELTPGKNGAVHASVSTDSVDVALAHALGLPAVKFIHGGGDPIVSARERWNMGNNTLPLSPGRIITYARNEVTNELLENNGVRVYPISASELARGRGGPRCMSLPINRDNLE